MSFPCESAPLPIFCYLNQIQRANVWEAPLISAFPGNAWCMDCSFCAGWGFRCIGMSPQKLCECPGHLEQESRGVAYGASCLSVCRSACVYLLQWPIVCGPVWQEAQACSFPTGNRVSPSWPCYGVKVPLFSDDQPHSSTWEGGFLLCLSWWAGQRKKTSPYPAHHNNLRRISSSMPKRSTL